MLQVDTQGSFNNHTVQDPGHGRNDMDSDGNREILHLKRESNPLILHSETILIITLPRILDITTLSTPTCLCGSWPERSVQTTTI